MTTASAGVAHLWRGVGRGRPLSASNPRLIPQRRGTVGAVPSGGPQRPERVENVAETDMSPAAGTRVGGAATQIGTLTPACVPSWTTRLARVARVHLRPYIPARHVRPCNSPEANSTFAATLVFLFVVRVDSGASPPPLNPLSSLVRVEPLYRPDLHESNVSAPAAEPASSSAGIPRRWR